MKANEALPKRSKTAQPMYNISSFFNKQALGESLATVRFLSLLSPSLPLSPSHPLTPLLSLSLSLLSSLVGLFHPPDQLTHSHAHSPSAFVSLAHLHGMCLVQYVLSLHSVPRVARQDQVRNGLQHSIQRVHCVDECEESEIHCNVSMSARRVRATAT
jgi:hypothetical protein